MSLAAKTVRNDSFLALFTSGDIAPPSKSQSIFLNLFYSNHLRKNLKTKFVPRPSKPVV